MPVDHPLRRQLHDELHARPSVYFDAPAIVRQQAFFVGGTGTHQFPKLLFDLDGRNTRDGKSGIASSGKGRIKWEAHTEFLSLTYVLPYPIDSKEPPDAEPIWNELIGSMPGQRITSVEVIVAKAGSVEIPEILGPDSDAVASIVGGGDAEVWSTFRLSADGATRILMLVHGLNAYRTGRMVRRLLEIENYRMMALLGHPLSQEAFVRCADLDSRLQTIMTALGSEAGKQQQILRTLASLSGEILDYSTKTRDRFSASVAYADLVFRRLEELREQRVEGHQRIGVFIDRRFRPAVKACEQAGKRVENAAVQVARASELLRTSVQVELEQQNAQMLESMERRVRAQVRLQEAVEGFSIIAISYYCLSMIKLLIESSDWFLHEIYWLKSTLVLAAPLIVFAVWLSVRRVHFSIKQSS